MADKTQNIFVNYKFNTADIERAAQPLNRVNQLNNQIQQSAEKTGSKISQEYQKSNKTILDMNNALTRLRSLIEVTSNPAKLKQLSGEYKNIKTQLDAATKSAFGFNKALQEQGNFAQSVAGKFGGLFTAVKGVIGAAIVRQIADVTLELAKLGGQAEGIKFAFERAFPDSVGLMNELRAATKGTISDVELMQRTLQATNLGVAVQELPELFAFAAARAQQTGESVDYLVDSIVRGIGRKSPLILDNLGLSAVRLKEKFDGAALASQSVADVTRAVAEIAEEEMAKMGGFVETSAQTVDQLNVAWTRLKTNLATKIDSSGIVKFFRDAFNGAADMLRTDKEIQEQIIKQRASTELLSLKENQLNERRSSSQAELVNKIQDEIRERMKLIEAGRVDLAILHDKFQAHNNTGTATGRIVEENRKAREVIAQQGIGIQKNLAFYQETIRLLRAYQAEVTKTAEVEEQSGIIERKKEEIKLLQEQIEKTNKLSDLGVGGKLTAKLEIAQAELGDLQRAFTDFQIKEFDDEIKNATETLDNIDQVMKRVGDSLSTTDPFGFTAMTPPTSVYEDTTWDLLKQDFIDNWRGITSSAIDIQAEQLKSLAETEVNSLKMRITTLREFYDEQISLAGDNDKAKEQLRIKEERQTTQLRNLIARKEKQAKRTQVLIDIAAGIGKAFATYPWPYSLIPAAFVAAQGAAQLAVINRQPTNFAKGSPIGIKGPGTETSDSIPANLSRGETVFSAKETRFASDVMKEIRAKTLDNKKLRELRQGRAAIIGAQVDTAGVVDAIKGQKPPDVIKISNIVYESKEYANGYKKRVRSRSMGL